jgi:hypothetical protein
MTHCPELCPLRQKTMKRLHQCPLKQTAWARAHPGISTSLWNPAGVHWNCWRARRVNPRQHEGYQPAARYSKKSRARIVPRCTSEVAGRGWVPGTLQLPSTLLYQRTGVTGPLVTISCGTFPGPGSGALVPAGSTLSSRFEEKTCYNPAQEAVLLGSGENGWFGIIGETRTHPATWPPATSIHRH